MKQRNVITAAITVAGLVVATGVSAVSAPVVQATAAQAAQGPTIKLIAAQHTITAQRFGKQVFVDPGIWVASLGAPLRLDVGRASVSTRKSCDGVVGVPRAGGALTRWRVVRDLPWLIVFAVLRGGCGWRGLGCGGC